MCTNVRTVRHVVTSVNGSDLGGKVEEIARANIGILNDYS